MHARLILPKLVEQLLFRELQPFSEIARSNHIPGALVKHIPCFRKYALAVTYRPAGNTL